MNRKSKNLKTSTDIKEGEKVDLNCGYFTAPSDGTLIIENGTWRFETDGKIEIKAILDWRLQ